MPRFLRYLCAAFLLVLLVGGPVGYALHRHSEQRKFLMVRDGVLYRSGQMTLTGLKRAVKDYGIKTVVTLRGSEIENDPAPPPDQAEEDYCKAQEINHYRLPPVPWWSPTGPAPADANVRRFVAILSDPANHPVLVHCFAGIHRTGAYVAIYRMEFEHWSNAEALAEMKARGYVHLEDEWDVLGYLEDYTPRRRAEPGTPTLKERQRPPVKPQ